MDAIFNLPDFVNNPTIYKTLLTVPTEVFLPNTSVGAIYGCVPNCIWHGGGVYYGKALLEVSELEAMRDFYNEELHVPVRFTFTNCLLTQEHCLDTYCNIVASVFHNNKNEILVSSPILEQYLRKQFPNYKYCRSIIATEKTPYQSLNYYETVIKRSCNNQWEYLAAIPQTERPFIEFLCNDQCPAECPYIYDHYRAFSQETLTYGQIKAYPCHAEQSLFKFKNLQTNPTFISREMIDNQYLPQGFCRFKLAGRFSQTLAIQNILTYLIKPEYQIDVLGLLLTSILGN